MTTLFRPTRPFPLPAGAAVVTHKGKPHARIGGALYPMSKDGTKYLKPAKSLSGNRFIAEFAQLPPP